MLCMSALGCMPAMLAVDFVVLCCIHFMQQPIPSCKIHWRLSIDAPSHSHLTPQENHKPIVRMYVCSIYSACALLNAVLLEDGQGDHVHIYLLQFQ